MVLLVAMRMDTVLVRVACRARRARPLNVVWHPVGDGVVGPQRRRVWEQAWAGGREVGLG